MRAGYDPLPTVRLLIGQHAAIALTVETVDQSRLHLAPDASENSP